MAQLLVLQNLHLLMCDTLFTMPSDKSDTYYMNLAAKLALLGHGGAEPNPMVGCVIVSQSGQIVGKGYHRNCGKPHAEINALVSAGNHAIGSTVYVTLEPCNHHGRTAPCTEALIKARIGKLVYARTDPTADAQGGGIRIKEAGIDVQLLSDCQPAIKLSDPFVYRIKTGLPWIIAKWAQTIDGKIATRNGNSQWLSNQRSRSMVHRQRGRVDAILTGIGTVQADDPLLTARNVRLRRTAKRIVIDPNLKISVDAKLVTTTSHAPTIIVCDQSVINAQQSKVNELQTLGAIVFGVTTTDGRFDLTAVLTMLTAKYEISTMLVEAGPRLLGDLFRHHLINEAWVFIAPILFADEKALSSATGHKVSEVTDGTKLSLEDVRVRGDDVMIRYGVLDS